MLGHPRLTVRSRMLPLLIVLLSLAAVAVAADRISLAFAENAASKWLVVHAPFDHPPSIQVHGVPFLTQAARGRYDDIEVSGRGLQIGDITGASLDAHFRGAHLSASDLFSRQVDQLPVDEVDGSVTVPYSELARLAQIPGMTLTIHQGGVTFTASLPIPGIGSVARVSGTASIEVSGRSLRLEVRRLAVAGISLPGVVVARLTRTLTRPASLPSFRSARVVRRRPGGWPVRSQVVLKKSTPPLFSPPPVSAFPFPPPLGPGPPPGGAPLGGVGRGGPVPGPPAAPIAWPLKKRKQT